MRKAIGALTACVLLSACATPYGGAFGGVKATWYNDYILEVRSNGNSFSGNQRMVEYVLLRAAQEAMKRGYPYLVMSSMDDTGRIDTAVVNRPYRTDFDANFIGNTVSGSAQTTGGPQIYSSYKPGRTAVFVALREIDEEIPIERYLDVAQIYSTYGPKYLNNFGKSPAE